MEETFWRLTWERFVAGGATTSAFGAWGADEWGPERRYLTVLAGVGGPEPLEGPSAAEVEVTGVCSFPDAVVAQVTPFEPAYKWRRTIRRAVPELATEFGDPDRPASEGGMAPHITLSYYDRELATDELAGRLQSFRIVEPIAVPIRELSLVSVQRPDGAGFTWDVIQRFALDGVEA